MDYVLVAELHEHYKHKRTLARQKLLVVDRAQPVHRCQPAAAEGELHSVSLEAVNDDDDDYDDDDKLVYCLKR